MKDPRGVEPFINLLLILAGISVVLSLVVWWFLYRPLLVQ